MELYFIELDNKKKFANYEQYLKLLSYEKQAKIHTFRFVIDKKLSLFSDLFVRFFACKALNLDNTALSFTINEYGKPYLIGYPDFCYNISHTRNAIAIGLSKKPIGVDIEKIKSIDFKIVERFFCKNELDYIISKNNDQKRRFYEIWTKKEAYIKWVGKGFSIPLSSFDVTEDNLDKILNIAKLNDYLISVCSEEKFKIVDIVELNESQASLIAEEFAYSKYNEE